MSEIRNMTNSPEKNTEAGTSSPGVMEVQSATPKKAQSTPTAGEGNERGWMPEVVETTATITPLREEVCNRRLEIPVSTGEDPFGWLARAGRYFLINGITDKEKTQSAMVCLEGVALGWLQWRESCRPFGDWAEFKAGLLERFKPNLTKSPQEELLSLRQLGIVVEYREIFEWLSDAMQSTEEDWLKRVFVIGLKEEIRAELGLMEPRDLEHVMNLAQRIDEQNWALGGKNRPKIGGKPSFPYGYSNSSGVAETPSKKSGPIGDYNPGREFSPGTVSTVNRIPETVRAN